jgi:DNA ligase D-like protein (predicted 3'-phosphoesterase)
MSDYSKKRDFSKTPEPQWSIAESHESIFVVQEHHASHLHWDFRLALDGVLKSWAIPKEPPTQKNIKRLAIQTEDHPLEYANFEGTIPEGQYGAGVVKIWDKGTFELLERTDKKYDFVLNGNKLKGKYHLIKFPKGGDNAWLFFKSD